LKQIVEIAQQSDAYILCDDVCRGTDQDGDGILASTADLYEKLSPPTAVSVIRPEINRIHQ
jgi:hypothetical protein